jgi:hypothetical protein
MSDKKRKTIVLIAAFAVFVIIPVLIVTIMKLSWNPNIIIYNGVQYTNTKTTVNMNDASQEFTKQYKASIDAKMQIKGMSVYESTADKIQNNPAWLFMVDRSGVIWVYQLASKE